MERASRAISGLNDELSRQEQTDWQEREGGWRVQPGLQVQGRGVKFLADW